MEIQEMLFLAYYQVLLFVICADLNENNGQEMHG